MINIKNNNNNNNNNRLIDIYFGVIVFIMSWPDIF